MNKSKQKGTTAETAVVDYLNESGITAVRNPPQGAKDKGDVLLLGLPVVVEVKNQKRLDLSAYLVEVDREVGNAGAKLGVAWVKRERKGNPEDWYVLMSGKNFIKVLKLIQKAAILEV